MKGRTRLQGSLLPVWNRPPATVRCRLSGHPCWLWRLAAIARVPFEISAVAVTFSVLHEQDRWDWSRWPVGSNRRPGGIEPTVDAGIDVTLVASGVGRYATTPVHHWMRTSP